LKSQESNKLPTLISICVLAIVLVIASFQLASIAYSLMNLTSTAGFFIGLILLITVFAFDVIGAYLIIKTFKSKFLSK
jgi:Flp pilus assembly protein protease CpaA